jgi:hypothetical protein
LPSTKGMGTKGHKQIFGKPKEAMKEVTMITIIGV